MKKQNVTHDTIYLMFSQAAFIASGYAIYIGLARLRGPSEYDIYAVIISLMTMVNLIFATGIPQAVSKYVAHEGGSTENIQFEMIEAPFNIIVIQIKEGCVCQ